VEGPALDQWKQRQRQNLMLRNIEPNHVFNELVVNAVYPKGELRVRPLEEEHIARITPESATQWVRRLLAGSAVEVAVVGDIERERAEELIKVYFGSLPERARIGTDSLAEFRKLERPTGPTKLGRKIPTKTDKALTVSGFYGPDQSELRDVRLLHMAARILTTRATEQLREQKQLAYSPTVQSRPGAEFPGFGVVTMRSPAAPERVEELLREVDRMFAAFAAEGPTEQEVGVARKQMANMLEENMRQPEFWVGSLMGMTYRGNTLGDVLSAPEQYSAFAGAEIREAFARYYRPENTFAVWVAPDPDVPAQGMVIEPRKATEQGATPGPQQKP
jgi:zinc protease